MNEEQRKNEIIKSVVNMEICPVLEQDKEELKAYKKFPIKDIAVFGGMAASFMPMFRTITQEISINGEGLYRMSFPEGVVGELAKAKDGTGYLGTVMNHGIAGQARWNPAENINGVSTQVLPIDPTLMVVVGILMDVENKLNAIQETGQEILDFLKLDKESKLKGNQMVLCDILSDFKYNWDNEKYKTVHYEQVLTIERESKQDMNFYHKHVEKLISKVSSSKGSMDVDSKAKAIQKELKNYQLALYNASFASYLGVLFLENFDHDYLNKKMTELEDAAYQYRVFYSKCFEIIDGASKSTFGKHVLSGIAGASQIAGKAIAKIPVISKGPVDEALIAAGEKLAEFKDNEIAKSVDKIKENRQGVVGTFLESMNTVDQLYNRPMMIEFDKEHVYVKCL